MSEYVNQVACAIATSGANPHAIVNQVSFAVLQQITAPPGGMPSGGLPAPGTDPQIILQVSNDGGRTWSAERPQSLGKIGAYRTLVRWRRLGRSNNRAFRVICSAAVQVALIECDLDSHG